MMPTSKTPKTPTALIYCRLSKADDSSHSLESQEALCREEAARRGLEVRAVFSEIISGGVAAYARPAFGNLLDSVSPGDVVLIRERSRLGRETLANLLSETGTKPANLQINPNKLTMRRLNIKVHDDRPILVDRRRRNTNIVNNVIQHPAGIASELHRIARSRKL